MKHTDFSLEQGEAWWARYKGKAEYIVWVTICFVLMIDNVANKDRPTFREKQYCIFYLLQSS
jgi:hypothetical protein